MATSLRQFQVELCEEHLEDAGFLYEQRRALHRNDEIPWLDVADFEARLEAHIDALVIGGDLALDVCARRAIEGEPGEVYAAVCVFCRQVLAPRFAEVLKAVDVDDVDKARAVSDALKYELPDAWRSFCSSAAAQPESKLAHVLPVVVGYQRIRPDADVPPLRSAPVKARPALIWSLGRTRAEFAAPLVREFVSDADTATASAALHAALRLHDAVSASQLMNAADAAVTHPIAVGLAGGRSQSNALVRALKHSDKPRDVLLACGLLGDVGIVRSLVNLLSDDDLAAAAADALHVITGAPLVQDAIVPDAVNEDELSDEELAAFRERGEAPKRPDGTPLGPRVRQLVRDPSAWQSWLDANASRFRGGARYRLGALYSPQVLLECLRSETYPKSYRAWVSDELLIRYGVDLVFEVDMPVAEQRQVLDRATGSIARATAAFQEGYWYFAGELVS